MSEHTALVTGAAGGIGRATVSLFSEKGWRVIGVDRADVRSAERNEAKKITAMVHTEYFDLDEDVLQLGVRDEAHT